MKCHDVLGVRESADTSTIENAYATKCFLLYQQELEIAPEALAKKQSELETAKADCLIWITLPNTEKIKQRIACSAKNWSSPNRMNGITIGCCTVCDDVCGSTCNNSGWGTDDSCCEYHCGSQAVPIFCDVVGYIIIGIYALIGLFKFGRWISRTNQENRYDIAIREQPELQRRLSASSEKVREITFAQSVKEKRRRDLNLFADFLEGMGADSTETLRQQENERVLTHSIEIQAAQREHDRLEKQIDQNNRIIQKGR